MAVSYPDVIGEYIDTPERFVTGGMQYAGYFDPATIAPGQVANLYVFLQNTLDVPLNINFKVNPPQTGGFLKSKNPILEIGTEDIELTLAAAEVDLLTLPVTTTEYAEDGNHSVTIEAKVSAQGKSERVRPAKSQSFLDNNLIDSAVGLNLVGSVGANYVEKSAKKAQFELKIAGTPISTEETPNLAHSLESIWKKKQAKFLSKAVQEINLREVKLKKELTAEALYANLYAENTHRFADAGIPLRIGEAIIMGKILTYTCQYFLSEVHRRNGLLVPMWEHAFEAEVDTTDSLDIIRSIGYHHLMRLSIAVSFGLIAKAVGRHLWPQQERQVLATYIADNVDFGQPLDQDFLYLPLLIAGTQISNKVKLEGENPSHTLALLNKAREARSGLFSDKDMAQAHKAFMHILKKATE